MLNSSPTKPRPKHPATKSRTTSVATVQKHSVSIYLNTADGGISKILCVLCYKHLLLLDLVLGNVKRAEEYGIVQQASTLSPNDVFDYSKRTLTNFMLSMRDTLMSIHFTSIMLALS